jgi:hypothetical protein
VFPTSGIITQRIHDGNFSAGAWGVLDGVRPQTPPAHNHPTSYHASPKPGGCLQGVKTAFKAPCASTSRGSALRRFVVRADAGKLAKVRDWEFSTWQG